jgi:hypothetical protein
MAPHSHRFPLDDQVLIGNVNAIAKGHPAIGQLPSSVSEQGNLIIRRSCPLPKTGIDCRDRGLYGVQRLQGTLKSFTGPTQRFGLLPLDLALE